MNTSELKRKLESSLEFLHSELSQVRTGRVTPGLLDSIHINAYDSKMAIREVGNITQLDPQTLAVSPWDKSLLETIAKAIRDSELKLNPAVKNDSVIIPVPSLTEERRVEFTKLVSTKVEETKNTMRGIRQDAMKDIDSRFANKEFGEDEKFSMKEDVEDLVKEYVGKAEEAGESKKAEILRVGS